MRSWRKNNQEQTPKKWYNGHQWKEMNCDEPHPMSNEKTQPIQWIEQPTGALVTAGSLWLRDCRLWQYKESSKEVSETVYMQEPAFISDFYSLHLTTLLTWGNTIQHGQDAIPMTLEWRKNHTLCTRWHGDGNSKNQSKFWLNIGWAIMGCGMPYFREFSMWCP